MPHHKEIEIDMDHPEFRDSQRITGYVERRFQQVDRNMRLNDVDELIDDHDARKRILKVKSRPKYFFQGS